MPPQEQNTPPPNTEPPTPGPTPPTTTPPQTGGQPPTPPAPTPPVSAPAPLATPAPAPVQPGVTVPSSMGKPKGGKNQTMLIAAGVAVVIVAIILYFVLA